MYKQAHLLQTYPCTQHSSLIPKHMQACIPLKQQHPKHSGMVFSSGTAGDSQNKLYMHFCRYPNHSHGNNAPPQQCCQPSHQPWPAAPQSSSIQQPANDIINSAASVLVPAGLYLGHGVMPLPQKLLTRIVSGLPVDHSQVLQGLRRPGMGAI